MCGVGTPALCASLIHGGAVTATQAKAEFAAHSSSSGGIKGTLAWQAPELFAGAGDASASAGSYSGSGSGESGNGSGKQGGRGGAGPGENTQATDVYRSAAAARVRAAPTLARSGGCGFSTPTCNTPTHASIACYVVFSSCSPLLPLVQPWGDSVGGCHAEAAAPGQDSGGDCDAHGERVPRENPAQGVSGVGGRHRRCLGGGSIGSPLCGSPRSSSAWRRQTRGQRCSGSLQPLLSDLACLLGARGRE